MGEELLSLKWNNHQSHFVDILTFLREQEIFVDVTLACGGKLYPTHKFVLSTCSDYFKQMFTRNPSKHPIVFMKDVSCRDLEALLDFMYNGEVNVPQSSLGSLIKTAEGLQIKGLAVPDDPPTGKKETSKRDKLDLDQKSSPPPKRLKVRERSPTLNSSASLSQHTAKSPVINSNTGCSSVSLPPEDSVDEDSRTSAHSGLSEHSHSLNTKIHVNSISQSNNESGDNCDNAHFLGNANEPSPGPSGLNKTPSKEEELDIKQEDIVDLENEEDEWGAADGDGLDGTGDASMGSDNAQLSDPLLANTDSSLAGGDHAMGLQIYMAALRRLAQEDFTKVETGLSTPSSRKVTCPICGSVTSRTYFPTHLRTHTGEKPFACPTCPYRTGDRSNLNHHVLRHKFYQSQSNTRN